MRIKHYPASSDVTDTNGVGKVVLKYHQYLQKLGIEFVKDNADADLIVSHAGMYDKPDILHLHGLYWTGDYTASDIEYQSNAAIVSAMKHAYQITVPSTWVAATLKREFRYNPAIIPHGIETNEWQHNFQHERYGLYNKNRDGFDVCDSQHLVELAYRLPQENFVATFCKQELDNVVVTGVLQHYEMKSVIQHAEIYLSLIKETFGIGILEALASGVPVLGFDYGGNADLIKHEYNGYLAKVGDYDDLATGYLWLKAHRNKLVANCQLTANNYSWDNVALKLLDVYKKALELKQQKPTWSIIIPCYNYAAYLPRAVQSVLKQEQQDNLEDIVIVNDGSTDNTDSVAKSLCELDNRIIYISQANAGVANARNTGIRATNSKYITCLDADDELLPNFNRILTKGIIVLLKYT